MIASSRLIPSRRRNLPDVLEDGLLWRRIRIEELFIICTVVLIMAGINWFRNYLAKASAELEFASGGRNHPLEFLAAL